MKYPDPVAKFLTHTLDNGLEIVAECDDSAVSSAVGYFVRTGARDEWDAVSGVSHFLEHMVFKGTDRRSAADANREFDEIGADYNAFTSEEATVYYAAVLPEYVDRAVELFGDLLHPALRDDDFVTEKQVIIEEIRMYEDQPPFGADERVKASYFGPHPMSRCILGTVDSIENLSASDMRDYARQKYSPKNITLVGTGRIDFDALVKSAQDVCGNWESFEVERTLDRAAPRFGFESVQKEAATQQYTIGLSPAPSAVDDDRYAAKLLAAMLGDDTGSRFYWELVDPGRAEHASVGHYDYADTGLFMTYLASDPDTASDVIARAHAVLRDVESAGFQPTELAQTKSKFSSRLVLSAERPRGRLFSVGGDWTQRHTYRTTAATLEAFAAVSLDDVHALLAKYPLSTNTTISIGPSADVAPPTSD